VLELLTTSVEEARTILRRHASLGGDAERMIALVREHGADARARAEIAREAVAAIQALNVFGEGDAKGALVSLAKRSWLE
jgi:octaprenyl-diphosphate synthase